MKSCWKRAIATLAITHNSSVSKKVRSKGFSPFFDDPGPHYEPLSFSGEWTVNYQLSTVSSTDGMTNCQLLYSKLAGVVQLGSNSKNISLALGILPEKEFAQF
jgi:hypothetical protein